MFSIFIPLVSSITLSCMNSCGHVTCNYVLLCSALYFTITRTDFIHSHCTLSYQSLSSHWPELSATFFSLVRAPVTYFLSFTTSPPHTPRVSRRGRDMRSPVLVHDWLVVTLLLVLALSSSRGVCRALATPIPSFPLDGLIRAPRPPAGIYTTRRPHSDPCYVQLCSKEAEDGRVRVGAAEEVHGGGG